jgi:hypothetical protein
MKLRWITILSACCFGLLPVQLAQGQVCLLSNASLAGTYGFVASEGGTIATTPGPTTPASGYSNSEVGNLLAGIAAGNQFGLSGVLTFDGAGNIDATSSASYGTSQVAGNYSVNPDCSVSVSLTDVFGTNTIPAKFVGIILERGLEIDLTNASTLALQTMTTSSTSSPGTTATTSTGQGLTIKLVQVLNRNGCSVATLGGLYGFVLNPDQIQQTGSTATGTTGSTTGTTSASTIQPTPVIGYLFFDSAGGITAQPTVSTTYSSLVFTGTYTVNSDCTGTMSISSSSASTANSTSTTYTTTTTTTTTTTSAVPNQTLTIDFVISPATVTGQVSSVGPALNLSYFDSNASGWGYAEPE